MMSDDYYYVLISELKMIIKHQIIPEAFQNGDTINAIKGMNGSLIAKL